ncbi:RNA polymerase sigma factor [compost metagenome]
MLNFIRKRKTKDRFIDLLSTFITENDNSVLARIDEKELAAAIETEIQNLPEKMRVIFEYSRKAYLSHREIAEQLGISDKTVKKQVANAIRILRLKLSIPLILIFFKIIYSLGL